MKSPSQEARRLASNGKIHYSQNPSLNPDQCSRDTKMPRFLFLFFRKYVAFPHHKKLLY